MKFVTYLEVKLRIDEYWEKLTPRRQNVVRKSLILAGKTLRFDGTFFFFLQIFLFFAENKLFTEFD